MRFKRLHSKCSLLFLFFWHCFRIIPILNHPEIPHSVHQGALSHHQARSPQTACSPPTPTPPGPLSCLALQLLQTQLHQAERHLLCLSSVFGAINARSPICAVRGEGEEEDMRQEVRLKKEKKRKIPLHVCQAGRKSCNYNIGGFGSQLASSVC